MPTPKAMDIMQRFAATGKDGPPPHSGTRFDASGTFQHEPGNTIVCHVVEGSRTQKALIALREAMMALPHADHFAFTPVSSLHMTLAQGVIEFRRKQDYWPAGLPYDAEIDGITDLYRDRMRNFADIGAFATRIDDLTPLGVSLAGATAEDEAVLRGWRDALCEPLGFRHPDHDAYRFHITLAYVVRWLPDEALPVYAEMLETWRQRLQRDIATVELDNPFLCSFDDMNHFEPLLDLRRNGGPTPSAHRLQGGLA